MESNESIYFKFFKLHFYILYSRYKLNSFSILKNPACTNVELRELIFRGNILLFTELKSAKSFADFAVSFLKRELREENIKQFEDKVSRDYFFKITSSLKPKFSNDNNTKLHIQNLLKELNFNLNTNFFDTARLRTITSYAHTIEEAKPAFAIHRDTWYANSESQINWWIPLFDVNEKNTFSFYPNYFSIPIKNNSNEFNYDDWTNGGGFQSTDNLKKQIFPEIKEEIPSMKEIKIPGNAGNLLLFSASHLHGTSPNLSNQTRFSIDFRTLDREDLNIRYAPNVDNKSMGSILIDMLSALNFEKY